MDALTYGLKGLCRRAREGSFATRSNREDILTMAAGELREGGFNLPGPASLKPKHVEFLVARWRGKGVLDATIKNRMAVLRWWAEKVNKAAVIRRKNEEYGIGPVVRTGKMQAYALDTERLAAVPCPLVRLSLELQAVFGLRREESIKFRVAWADRGDRIELRPSWTKGGRGRSVPVVTAAQRELLDRIRAMVGKEALIPRALSYAQQLKVYEHQTLAAGLRTTHGLRHYWAQERYRVLTGWAAPAAGGAAELGERERRVDRAVRLQLSQELGHNRIEITRTYLG